MAEVAIWTTVAGPVSALAAVTGLFFAWRNARQAALRSGDVLVWANDAICELQSLLLVCLLPPRVLNEAAAQEKLRDVIFNTSILVERGRLFFKNQAVKGYGKEKESAYQGYRPMILDQLVIAHQIACGWITANDEARLRMRILAEDCLKKFVSIVQKEVGRSRTASADTARGGQNVQLKDLLAKVESSRLDKLREARGASRTDRSYRRSFLSNAESEPSYSR